MFHASYAAFRARLSAFKGSRVPNYLGGVSDPAPNAFQKPQSATDTRKELVKRRVRKMRGNRTRKAVSAYEQTHALMLEQLNG